MKQKLIIYQVLIIIISPVLFSQVKYWEDLGDEERKIIINSSETFSLAKDYYTGNLIATDDSLTSLLLDTLVKPGIFNPLYFYEFNSILKKSDGALAEAMGEYCIILTYNYPNETLNYLAIGKKRKHRYLSCMRCL